MRINLLALIIGIAFLNASANVKAQTVSLKTKDAPLKTVFEEIKKQTGYFFWYEDDLLQNTRLVTLNLSHATLKESLDACFKNQPVTYAINDKTIVVRQTEKSLLTKIADFIKSITVSGKVTDENGLSLPGATIKVKGTSLSATTNADGFFTLNNVEEKAMLIISYIGYETKEIPVTENPTVALIKSTSKLDEVHVIAYGTSTQRLTTGAVSKVTSEQIENNPVANPLAALEGRVSGLVISQNTGLPGSGYKVQIRGRTSIENSSDPLYIIDGVPFNGTSLATINNSSLTQQSPLSSINPEQIESIEVLKDADATSIYGSRGANGVILITTKKGVAGKTMVNANFYTGAGTVTRTMNYLNTGQYLEMRREAFKNDNITPTVTNSPDLLVWDNNRYTDWKKLLIGGTARTTDMQVSLSGGNTNTQFLIGSNYHHETTVFPGDLSGNKANVNLSLNHKSTDNKLSMAFSASYNNEKNNLISTDLTTVTSIVPNAPVPFDGNGNLNWSEGGVYFNNPFAYLKQPYTGITDNLISNLNIQYRIMSGLTLKANLGFTNASFKQSILYPKSSLNPSTTTVSSAIYGNSNEKTWIIEPQAEYKINIKSSTITVLAGTTLQQNVLNGSRVNASNFVNDALIESPSAASTVTSVSSYTNYKYQGAFARINYNLDNKYLLNLTGRRDGSSRFGPGKQFANFGAMGAAWVFSEEHWLKDNFPILSFGKLRGSYGISGNDKIGDYNFLDTWRSTVNPYQNIAGLVPSALNNSLYSWEYNKKTEAALDLGFWKDRFLLSVSYYSNRSGNQLVNYLLPAQTGFSSILENLPALVENSGWEFSFNSINIKSKSFSWTTSFNVSFVKNKLLEFPDLDKSSYANTYTIGQPLDIKRNLLYYGVDPQTGIYTFNSTNLQTGLTNSSNISPQFYGGFGNTMTLKDFQLDFFFQFMKRNAYNYLDFNAPGTMYNQPDFVLSRWQKAGDIADIEKFTTSSSGTAGSAYNLYSTYSSARVSDASYIRLKNLSLSYNLANKWASKLKAENIKIFFRGENLLTITRFKGNDPETISSNTLPPLKMLTAGIHFTY